MTAGGASGQQRLGGAGGAAGRPERGAAAAALASYYQMKHKPACLTTVWDQTLNTSLCSKADKGVKGVGVYAVVKAPEGVWSNATTFGHCESSC